MLSIITFREKNRALKVNTICFFLFLFWVFPPNFAFCQSVTLDRADKLEYYIENGKKVIKGVGNVSLVYKGNIMTADEIIAYPNTKDVMAKGNVVYREKDSTLYADSFTYNLDSLKGVLINAQIITDMAYLTGREVKKTGAETYEVRDASYTTCKSCIENNEPPHWQIRSSFLDLKVEGYAQTSATTFNILDLPIVYFPWFIIPIKTERQTGFLLPELFSVLEKSKTSMGLGAQFFWAISRSYDATHSYNFVPKRGHKNGVEFRYALKGPYGEPGSSYGNNKFFFIKDTSDEYYRVNENPNNHRWGFSLSHLQDFGNNLRLRAGGAYLSDPRYLTDFKGDISGASSKALKSSTIFIYNTESTVSTLENSYYYHLTAEDQKDVTHKLPEINFYSSIRPVADFIPAFFSFNSTYTYFAKRRNRLKTDADSVDMDLAQDHGNDGDKNVIDIDGSQGNSLIDPGESKRGHRLMFRPELSLPFRVKNHFYINTSFSNNSFFYLPQVESNTSRKIPYKYIWGLSVDASTSASKVFSVGEERYKHKIYPKVRYSYIFGEYKKGFHPYFDSFDETGKVQKIAFILDNLLIAEKNYTELLQLTLEQRANIEYWIKKYQAKNSLDMRSAEEEAGIGHVFDPFKIVIKLNFSTIPFFLSSITGRGEMYYDHYAKEINRITSQLKLTDKRGDWISLSYTQDTRDPVSLTNLVATEDSEATATEKNHIHYLRTALGVNLHKNFSLSYYNDYSIKEGKRHQDIVNLYYLPDSKCWSLKIKYETIADAAKNTNFSWSVSMKWGRI